MTGDTIAGDSMAGPGMRAQRNWLWRIGLAGCLAGLLGLSAWADPPAAPLQAQPRPATPLALAAEESGVRQTEDAAVAQAVGTGQRVEIGAYRGERREVYANPDGTTTAVEHAQPVRVVRGGRWVPIDPTLVIGGDGSVRPTATTLGMRLSGGGRTPLIAVDRAGRSLTLGWQGDLPKPVLAGDRATYAEVLSGVDLVVTVGAGGFSHVLVIKTPEAAANPKLAELTFGLSTAGLTVRDSGAGGLTAVDTASGGAVFEAPTPMMWDSGAAPGAATASARTLAGAAPAAAAPPADGGASTSAANSPTTVAPESAKQAALGVRLGQNTLTLVPDQAMLTDPTTQWPVYIDPIWESTGTSGWAMVANGYPNEEYWRFSGNQGLGKCPVSSGQCNGTGIKRLFYALPTPYSGKTIISAEFRVTMTQTNGSGRGVALYRAGGGISSATNWNNQPSLAVHQQTQWPSAAAGSCTASNQNVGFNATGAVREAASSGWSTTTFGMIANSETDDTYWKRFCGNAILSVNYNRAPDQPASSSLTTSPGGVCATGTTRPYVDTPPVLTMVLTDPDNSPAHTEQLYGEVSVSWEQPVGTTVTRTYATVVKGSGAPFQIALPTDIPENVIVSWNVRASDGTAWGAPSTTCQFIYDHTQPAAPDVDSPQYLPLDATETTSACTQDNQWRGSIGEYGTFTFDSASTDTVTYRYGFNTNPSPNTVISPATGGAPASVTWMPDREGPNFVTVQAIDRAGLSSTIATCVFAVPARPAVGDWALAETEGSTSAADARGTHPATPAANAIFGAPGPGCQDTGTGTGTGTGAQCQLDRAVSLSGTPGSYLTTTSAGLLNTATGFSATAWVRLTDTTTTHIAVSQDGSGEPGFTLGFDATTKTWTFGTPVTDLNALGNWSATSTATAAPNEWTHLTGVYDPVRQTLTLYVNGQAQPPAQRRSAWKSRGPIQIGRKVAKSGYTSTWAGQLADVSVFDRIIVPAEVAELSTLLPVRRAYWPLNSAVDGVSPEYGGREDLTLAGGARIYAPVAESDPGALMGVGHLLLDGVDDYASTTGPIVDTVGSFTVSLRVRLASPTCGRDMSVISQAGANTSGFLIRCSSANRWSLVIPHSDVTNPQATVAYDDTTLPSADQPGQHLAVTYNGFLNEVRLYVDGQVVVTAVGVHAPAWAAGGGVQFGRALVAGAFGEYFAGAIDDVRVYSGIADEATIALLASVVEQPDL